MERLTLNRKPENYQAPNKESIVGTIQNTGLEFKGESVPWAIATEPVVLPESLGQDLWKLGDALAAAYNTEVWLLKHGPKKEREMAESFVKTGVPETIPTDSADLQKRSIKIFRPDIVLSTTKEDDHWKLRCGIAEVETRPAGTFMIPALLEGYGLDKKRYMETWAEHFGGHPWTALYPKEWELYAGELKAFEQSLGESGGTTGGVHCLDEMADQDIEELVPKDAFVYLFGYLDVWERSGSLGKAKKITNSPNTIVYNPLNYPYETKSSLVLFQQPWFQELLTKQQGAAHSEALKKWLIEGFVLNVEAPQELNPSQLIKDRKKWVLKRAGFHQDSTESRGLVFPEDKNHAAVFTQTLQSALSGTNGQWIAQKLLDSKIPQEFYRPDNGEVDHFSGSTRLTPMYIGTGKDEATMLGVISTVTYGSDRAHGGSGKEIKPGMSVMAPVVFGETEDITYEE